MATAHRKNDPALFKLTKQKMRHRNSMHGKAPETPDDKLLNIQLYTAGDNSHLYILIELNEPSQASDAVSFIEHYKSVFKEHELAEPGYNNGHIPAFIVVGRNLKMKDRTKLNNEGARIFDLNRPSNKSSFQDGNKVVEHIHREFVKAVTSNPAPTVAEDDEHTAKAADVSEYYKPVNSDEVLSSFFKYINK